MKYFNNCKTLDELKAEYRRLVKVNHPDRGGDLETMKAINNEYEARFEVLKRQHNETHDEEHQTTETAAEFIEIINALLKLDGLEVELCGAWLWIGGNTREHKEELKALGCNDSSVIMHIPCYAYRDAFSAAHNSENGPKNIAESITTERKSDKIFVVFLIILPH